MSQREIVAQHVLVLYDEGQPTSEIRWSAHRMFGQWQQFPYTDAAKLYTTMLVNLLGGLSTEVVMQPVSGYQKGMAAQSRRTFYLATTPEQTPPEALVQDILGGAPITWIGYNAEALQPIEQDLGIRIKGMVQSYDTYETGFREIHYKEAVFSKTLQPMDMLMVETSAEVKVHAFAQNPSGERLPYIIQRKNFWLVTDIPFTFIHERDRYMVFADLLRTMLDLKTVCEPTALLRIEDVSPYNDAASLKSLFSLLIQEKVPFNVALIPYYVNEPQGIRLSWQDNPEALEVLLDVSQQGWAAIWQHGTTHHTDHYPNPDGVTATDWEFWDSHNFRPLENLDETQALARVLQGKQALFDLGFSPVGWVTPHYAAPASHLKNFNQAYNLYFERRIVQLGAVQASQFFPYPLIDSLDGNLLPENAGYISDGNQLEDILQTARLNRVLQCPYLGLFIHPFLFSPNYKGSGATSLEDLQRFIANMRSLGYRFYIPGQISLNN